MGMGTICNFYYADASFDEHYVDCVHWRSREHSV